MTLSCQGYKTEQLPTAQYPHPPPPPPFFVVVVVVVLADQYNSEHPRYRRQNNRHVDSEFRSWCESRGGRPGLSVLTSFMVSLDVKLY